MSQIEAQRHTHAVAQGPCPVPFRNEPHLVTPALRPLVVGLDHALATAAGTTGDPRKRNRACDDLLAFARQEKRNGREIILATPSDSAELPALHAFDFADRILARAGGGPLSGTARARRLRQLFPQGFIYAGATPQDIPVWQASDHIILVGADTALKRRLHAFGRPITVLGETEKTQVSRVMKQGIPKHIGLTASLCLMIGLASLMLLIR